MATSLRSGNGNSPISVHDSKVFNNGNHGISSTSGNSGVNISYSFVYDNGNRGVTCGSSSNSDLVINNSQIHNNSNHGAYTSSKLISNYSNFTNNGDDIYSNTMSDINNCIIWGNNNGNAQIYLEIIC